MANGPTKYNQEIVDQFWAQAVETAAVLKAGIASLLPKWNVANEKCSGVPAIPTATAMVGKMKEMADTLEEAAQTGSADNRKYQEEMASMVVGQGINMD